MSRATMAMSYKDIAVISLLVASATFLVGYMLGTADHSGKDAVMEQYQSWDEQEQQDFVIAALKGKDTFKREIAEDWCAINRKTTKICQTVKLAHPIRGVK